MTEQQTQIGVGLYTTGPRRTLNAIPSASPVAEPNDYEKDGIRYRATVGGDALKKAAVGDPGQSAITATYFPSTADLVFRTLCLAPDRYVAALSVNGTEITRIECGPGASTDAGTSGGIAREPGKGWPDIITVGVDGTALPSFRDVNGHPYELRDLRTAAATSLKLTVATPAGTPYLLAYESTADLGTDNLRLALDEQGASGAAVDGPAGGVGTVERTARPAGTATLRVAQGRPVKGQLILAIYTPVR